MKVYHGSLLKLLEESRNNMFQINQNNLHLYCQEKSAGWWNIYTMITAFPSKKVSTIYIIPHYTKNYPLPTPAIGS